MTYPQATRIVLLVFGIILLLAFLYLAQVAVLLLLSAYILALALTPVVNWMERHRINRTVGSILAMLALLGVLFVAGLLVVPILFDQASTLLKEFPSHVEKVDQQVTRLLSNTPFKVSLDQLMRRALPGLGAGLTKIGTYSVSIVTGLVLVLIFFATAVYILATPRGFLRFYLYSFPEHLREKAARAYQNWAKMITAWIWSNFVIGGVQGTAFTIFLTLMDVPGALIWGVLAFLGEFVPKVGAIVMTIAPTVVAFTVSPMTGIWVLLVLMAFQEIVEDVLAPYLRGTVMHIHPALTVFAILAFSYALGIIGALIALPLISLAKVMWDEFYYEAQRKNEPLIDAMLYGGKESKGKASR